LRPLTSADADALFALHNDAHVLRYWDSAPWTERSRAERFIAACEHLPEEGSGEVGHRRQDTSRRLTACTGIDNELADFNLHEAGHLRVAECRSISPWSIVI
jgi:RimJ/RimL family protein N-acetyltransferase